MIRSVTVVFPDPVPPQIPITSPSDNQLLLDRYVVLEILRRTSVGGPTDSQSSIARSRHMVGEFSAIASCHRSSCHFSSRRVPRSLPAPLPIARSAPKTTTRSHSPALLDGRI